VDEVGSQGWVGGRRGGRESKVNWGRRGIKGGDGTRWVIVGIVAKGGKRKRGIG